MLDGELAPAYAGKGVGFTVVATGPNLGIAEKYARPLLGNLRMLVDLDELVLGSLRHTDPAIKAPFPLQVLLDRSGVLRVRFHEEFEKPLVSKEIDALLAEP